MTSTAECVIDQDVARVLLLDETLERVRQGRGHGDNGAATTVCGHPGDLVRATLTTVVTPEETAAGQRPADQAESVPTLRPDFRDVRADRHRLLHLAQLDRVQQAAAEQGPEERGQIMSGAVDAVRVAVD